MKAVHFGAGNIGRGFIGLLLYQSGFKTTFVDVNQTIIEALNERESYKVLFASEEKSQQIVENITGINSVTDSNKVVQAIVEADLITTAVGANVLPIIAELLAQGLRERLKQNKSPLSIIACENMVNGSSFLQEQVWNVINEQEQHNFAERFSFPNATVDRIVPDQTRYDILEVSVEPYYEWIIEANDQSGEKTPIQGVTFVSDLNPYVERKLFTVNTGHASVAYLGHYMGYRTITEAMKDERLTEVVQKVLQESGEALIQKYHFDRHDHEEYITRIMNRFRNPYISDQITRVARNPIRKLGQKDRFIRPALIYMEKTNEIPEFLATVIATVLHYNNENDEEAVKLQKMVQEIGYDQTLQKITRLEAHHPLISFILEQIP